MKTYRFALTLISAVPLAGCGAGVQYAVQEYQGIPVQSFNMGEGEGERTFRIFDKPAANKLMITPSLGDAAGMGFASGLTFGALNADNPKPIYESAAAGYLKSTGRTCRIVDGYLVEKPQWEFKYDCSIPAPVPPAASRPRAQNKRT